MSKNPILAAEKKGQASFDRIIQKYTEKQAAETLLRSLSSGTTRIELMVRKCVRFSARYSFAMRAKKSGRDEKNMKLATVLFNDVNLKGAEGDSGKLFQFLEAWQILHNHQKFM